MAKFRYVGSECIYPNILIPGEGSLVAKPGDVREFDTPPDLVWWVREPDADPKPGKTAPPEKEVK